MATFLYAQTFTQSMYELSFTYCHICNTIAIDGLVMQATRTSADVIITKFTRHIPVSASENLIDADLQMENQENENMQTKLYEFHELPELII